MSYSNPTPEEIAEEVAAEAALREQMRREYEEENMTQQQTDIQTLVQSELAKALGNLGGLAPAPVSFEDALSQVDPADSEAALAMLNWLLETRRLGRVGVLDGGGGYLFVYEEPKGSSKAGYKPGATQGDRIVDEAVAAQRASGAKPVKQGMCSNCYSIVAELEDKLVTVPDGNETCPNSVNGHQMA